MEKFIVLIDEELLIIEAQNYSEISKIMKKMGEKCSIFYFNNLDSCSKFKVIDNELFEADTEKPKNEINGEYKLKRVTYSIHKKNKEKILKASYNFKTEKGWVWASKYLCFNKEGYPKEKAFEWLSERTSQEIYEKIQDTETAIKFSKEFIAPIAVQVQMNNAGYPEITEEIWGV